MSDQSEFEKFKQELLDVVSGDLREGMRLGLDEARDWILSKANKLDKQYIDDNDFPLIFLDDLEEACK